MLSPFDLASEQLARLDPQEALATLDLLEAKRKEDGFVRYWTPNPTQAVILKEFTEKIKVFAIRGGNRSGKTEIGAFITVAWALGKEYFRGEPAWELVKDLPIPEHASNIWVVGLDFTTLRDVIWREKLRYGRVHPPLLPRDPQIVTKVNDSDFQVFFSNGSVITGKSADSGREKFQGASVDLIWIDEEVEEDVYDECYQRTSDCKGKILLTLTPLSDIASGARHPWVYDLYEKVLKHAVTDVKFVSLSVFDNPYVADEEKEKLRAKWAGHFEERARLYGEFIQRSGLVYNMWDPKAHLVKPGYISRDWFRVVCIDPAATGTTAALWCAVDPHGNLTFYREYYEKDLIVSDHAKNILVRNAGDPVDVWLIDPKWGSQRNNETHKSGAQLYRENRIPVRLAVVGEDYGLKASMEYLSATTNPTTRHPRAYLFSDLENFKHEIEHYTWAFFGKGENKGLSKDKPTKRNDHLMNAFQYICAMRPRGRGRKVETPEERKLQVSLNSYT
jgi:phage terminase large subunit-like protein